MSRRTPQILALTILLPAAIMDRSHTRSKTFKLLGDKEIRARVVGKDITDSTHWMSYLRPDGSARKWAEHGPGLGEFRRTNSVCRIQL
jgi:hypothetical protein